jgi:NAD(P)-dependent dehydrogenase (short-subunit alcohol dehydrogenase family)
MDELDGKVALVTGSASGIGAATAALLADRGASVVLADINAEGAATVAKEIAAAGGKAVAVGTDVSDEDQIRAAVAAAVSSFGGLHILHNCAALQAPEVMARDGAITDIDADLWDRVMQVNLRGYALTAKHAIPHMLTAGGGVIVNTASGTGVLGEQLRPAYGTSKAAIIGLTRNIAAQYGKRNIRCVGIALGLVMTPGLKAGMPPFLIDMMTGHHLIPALAEPEDIAEVVGFLASDRARFITGHTLMVDGGFCSHTPSYADEHGMFAMMAAGEGGQP